jgi:NADPH:quinone reductase-like Zn-dependent oxidoreductase
VAGVVETVGPAVHGFAVGDEVFGYIRRDDIQFGTYAEVVPAPERTVSRKPESLSFAESAVIPLAGLTAYQALTEALRVNAHDRVLIHAAAGGVGSFAVQIAKALGATVVGVAAPAHHDYLRELGADEVVDHTAGPVSAQLKDRVDVVLDLVGGDALADAPRQVRRSSRVALVASVVDPVEVRELHGVYVFVRPDRGQLAILADLADSGALRVPVEASYPLAEAAAAQRRSEEGRTRGKIVLTVG